jgi:hypothetical protein
MSPAEPPVAWRCSAVFATRQPPFKRAPEHQDFATEAEARARHDALVGEHGDDVVACVVPLYPKPVDATSKEAKRRSIEALGWPVQMAPPKRGRR